MTRVHGISRLVWLEEARLLLDRIWLHHNVMLHQLWLVTSLQEKIKLKHCFPSSHYLQQPEVDQFEMLSTYCIRSLTCKIASWRQFLFLSLSLLLCFKIDETSIYPLLTVLEVVIDFVDWNSCSNCPFSLSIRGTSAFEIGYQFVCSS